MLSIMKFVGLSSLGVIICGPFVHLSRVVLCSRRLCTACGSLRLSREPASGHRYLKCACGLFSKSRRATWRPAPWVHPWRELTELSQQKTVGHQQPSRTPSFSKLGIYSFKSSACFHSRAHGRGCTHRNSCPPAVGHMSTVHKPSSK